MGAQKNKYNELLLAACDSNLRFTKPLFVYALHSWLMDFAGWTLDNAVRKCECCNLCRLDIGCR